MASDGISPPPPPSKPPITPAASDELQPRRRRDWPKSLYLFYTHGSLYKLDLPDPNSNPNPKQPIALSPRLTFPADGRFPIDMKCARLGSKVYFLGGQFLSNDVNVNEIFPRDVYFFDLAASCPSPTKLNAQLNAGKPNPLVFVADNKIFVLSGGEMVTNLVSEINTPNVDFWEYLQLRNSIKSKPFECYDPGTGKWRVLEGPRVEDYTHWEGCAVLENHGLVLVFGWQWDMPEGQQRIQLVYDLSVGKWALLRRPPRCGYFVLAAAVADDESGGYPLYGVGLRELPFKSHFQVTKEKNHLGECNEAMVEVEIVKSSSNGKVFLNPFVEFETGIQLHYLGGGYFCHVVAGPPGRPDRWGDLASDPFTRGVKVVVFKEIDDEQDQHCNYASGPSCTKSNSKSLSSFKVEILYISQFVMKTSSFGAGDLMGDLVSAFVVSHDQQQKMEKKMKRKMKSNKRAEVVVAEE